MVAKTYRVPPTPKDASARPVYKIANWIPEGALHELDPTSHGSGLKDVNVAVRPNRNMPCKCKWGYCFIEATLLDLFGSKHINFD